MRTDKFLFITDSPGKLPKLTKVIEQIGIVADFVAIGPAIFDYPENHNLVGIDHQFTENLRPPVSSGTTSIKKIQNYADQYAFILVATEPDVHGDALAVDVLNSISANQYVNLNNVLRCKIHALDTDNIELALQSSVPVEAHNAWPSQSARMLNRVILSTYSTDKVRVDSILSPILNEISNAPIPFKKLTLTLPCTDDGDNFIAEIMVTAGNTLEAEYALSQVNFLPACSVSSSGIAPSSRPWGFNQSITAITERIGGTAIDVAMAMNELYESGLLSYPKANVSFVSHFGLEHIAGLARKCGIKASTDSEEQHIELGLGYFKSSIMKMTMAESPHESPRPLSANIDITLPIKLMTYKDAVLTLITRNIILAGINVTVDKPNTDPLPQWAKNIEWKRYSRPALPWKEPAHEAGYTKLDPIASIMSTVGTSVVCDPMQLLQEVSLMLDIGLLDDELKLTNKGRFWVKTAPLELLQANLTKSLGAYIYANRLTPPAQLVPEALKIIDAVIYDEVMERLSSA